jgi:hypothetical protein
MNRYQDVWSKLTKRIEDWPNDPFQHVWGDFAEGLKESPGSQVSKSDPNTEVQDDTTVRAASAVLEGLFNHKLTQSEKKIAGPAVHYILGTGVGGLYGAAAEIAPKVTAGTGVPFGAVFWLVVDEGAVPLLRLSEGPTAYPLSIHAYALSSHIFFGLTAEVVRRAVRKAM